MILKIETSNNFSELAIKNIEAIAGGEDSIMEDPGDGGDGSSCSCECPDGNGSCTGSDTCYCSGTILTCDDTTVFC